MRRFFSLHPDFLGFSTSLLCAIHCALMPFLFTLLPLSSLQVLSNPWVEYAIIVISLCIAIASLSHGYRRHHKRGTAIAVVLTGFLGIGAGQIVESTWFEAILTSTGALMVASAHVINWQHIRQSRITYPECLKHKARQ